MTAGLGRIEIHCNRFGMASGWTTVTLPNIVKSLKVQSQAAAFFFIN